MSPEELRRVRDLFDQAIDLPPEQRPSFLERAAGDDATVMEEARKLLRAHERSQNPVDRLVERAALAAAAPAAAALSAGRRLGRYVIERPIGAGGMGTVYLARHEGTGSAVALKVMQPGVTAAAGALARFEREARILGRLRHPGIAQVHDAGTETVDGIEVPYFAMEHIAGARHLTDHAAAEELDLRGKLKLFLLVCDAVHHGHERGVVHRDLKPSNILVGPDGQPKVIDYGIARAADAGLAVSVHTTPGQILGTLRYMSPEQVNGDPGRLDHRSDVYSLGVVLYELLSGELPYRISSLHQAAEVILEEPPARLRTHMARCPRDVELIVGKTLAKERERRYASARELADDIRRFLRNEAVLARPPSLAYQLRTFLRRHGRVAAVFILITVILTVATVVSARLAAGRLRALQEAEKQGAATALATARALAERDDPGGAAVFLERVPGALRNWEWHHVKGTLDQSLSSVAFPQGDVAVHFREATEGGGAECSVWIAAGDSAGELEVAEWAVAPGVLERRSAVGRYSIGKRCAHLAFSADGRRLAAIDEGGTLHVFSLPPSADPAGAPPEGREMEAEVIVENPEAKTWDGVAFHPALPLLALSCTCGVVEIRDAADGACAARLAGHTQLTRSLAFSPDGSRLVSTSYDKTARIWDVERSIGGHPERGACVAVLRGHDYYVVGAAFRPDGRELATASLDGTIKLWDVARSEAEYGSEGEAASGALKETLRGHESGVRSVAYHPGGEKLLASASVDRTVRLWSLEEEAPIGQWGLEPPRLWHVAQRAEIARLRGHRAAVEEVAFSPAGELVVSKGYPLDGTCELRMWLPFASGESPVLSGHGSSVHGVAWSFDGSLVASAGGDGSAGIWDAKSGAGLARLWHPKVDGETTPVLAVRFHPGEKALATGTTSGTVRLWRWREDPRQFEEPLLIDWPARPAAPPGSKRSWWGVASLAMSDDGSLMASGLSAATLEGEYHHRVEVWRWEAGAQADAGAEDDDDGDAPEPLAAFPAAEHLSPFQPVAFLGGGRAGRHLVTPGAGSEAPSRGRRGPPSSLQVFEVDWPGREVRLLSRSEDLDGAILDVAVLPGGDPPLLAAGLADGTVHLWSVLSPRQLEPLRVLRGHTAPVTAVAFHPDPRASRLASGSNDRALKLWDLAAGLAVYSYEEHHGTVNDLEFGPLPGAALASASAGDEGRDNVVRLLEAAVPGEWVERRARTAHAERQVLLHLRPVLGEDTIPGDLALDLVRGMDPSLDATAVELLRFRRGPEKVAALAEAIAEHAGADGAARDRALAWVRTALAIDPGHEGLLEAEKSLRARGPEARGAEARGAEARGSTP